MIILLQVDKSGRDIFEKDYSLAVVVNKKEVYGVNIPQEIKDRIIRAFKEGKLWKLEGSEKRHRMRLRILFHTAVIILIIKSALQKENSDVQVNIELCNDFDGHFHEIRDMIYKNLVKVLPSLKLEDIVHARFSKSSLVDIAGKALREHKNIPNVNICRVDLNREEVVGIIKK